MLTLRFYPENEDKGRAYYERPHEDGLPLFTELPRAVGFSLPIHAATPDHTTGICIWQGESVEAVKELVESVVGPYSDNEYFEVEVDGLPAG